MYIVDTNLLVNLCLQKYIKLDQHEEFLLDKLSSLNLSDVYIADFVLTEYTTLMLKVIPKKFEISKNIVLLYIEEIFIEIFREANILIPTANEIKTSFNYFIDENKGKNNILSLQDILLGQIAFKRKLHLLTNDKQLNDFYNGIKS